MKETPPKSEMSSKPQVRQPLEAEIDSLLETLPSEADQIELLVQYDPLLTDPEQEIQPSLPLSSTPQTHTNLTPSNPDAWGKFDNQLAIELVANMTPRAEVAKRFGLSVADLRKKLADPQFRTILRQTSQFWNADSNAKERIRAKSSALVEDSLLAIFGLIHSPETAPPVKNDAFRHLARVAAVDSADRDGANAGERFTVTINLPAAATQPVIIDASKE